MEKKTAEKPATPPPLSDEPSTPTDDANTLMEDEDASATARPPAPAEPSASPKVNDASSTCGAEENAPAKPLTTRGALEPGSGAVTTGTIASALQSTPPGEESAMREAKKTQPAKGSIVTRLTPSTALEPSVNHKDEGIKRAIQSQQHDAQGTAARLRSKQEENAQTERSEPTDISLESSAAVVTTGSVVGSGDSSVTQKDQQTKQNPEAQRAQEAATRLQAKQKENEAADKESRAMEPAILSVTRNPPARLRKDPGNGLSNSMKLAKGESRVARVEASGSPNPPGRDGEEDFDDAQVKRSVIQRTRNADEELRAMATNPAPAKRAWNVRSSNATQHDISPPDEEQPQGRGETATRRGVVENNEVRPGAYAVDLDTPLQDASFDFQAVIEQGEQETLDEPEAQDDAEVAVVDAEIAPIKEEGGSPKKCLWFSIVAVVVVILTVVVIAVVLAGTGDNDGDRLDTLAPTEESATEVEPTNAPSPSPTSTPEKECYATTIDLLVPLKARDLNEFADIQICRNSILQVGGFVTTGEEDARPTTFFDPYDPLVAQSNMRIRCGEYGRARDNCRVVNGGTPAALVQNSKSAKNEAAAYNVTFEGLTFESSNLVDVYNGGDITFRNCLFRRSVGSTPIIIDYQPAVRDTDLTIRQTVTFESCVFEDMEYGRNEVQFRAANLPSDTATLVLATHPWNTVIFRDCVFRNNEVNEDQLPGHLITSLGAELQIEQSCFGANAVGRSNSPVLLSGDFQSVPFVDGLDNYAGGTWDCSFVFESLLGLDSACTRSTTSTVCNSSLAEFRAFW